MDLTTTPDGVYPNTPAAPSKKKRRNVLVLILVLTLLFVTISGMIIAHKAKEAAYYTDLETVSYLMLDGAASAETAGNMIHMVWQNAIYQTQDSDTDPYTMKNGKFVDDFNDALLYLFVDEDFAQQIQEIKDNQDEVADLMKRLKNPPSVYEEAYSMLREFHDSYLQITNIVISPNGSLQTFTEKFQAYDYATAVAYQKMELYLD